MDFFCVQILSSSTLTLLAVSLTTWLPHSPFCKRAYFLLIKLGEIYILSEVILSVTPWFSCLHHLGLELIILATNGASCWALLRGALSWQEYERHMMACQQSSPDDNNVKLIKQQSSLMCSRSEDVFKNLPVQLPWLLEHLALWFWLLVLAIKWSDAGCLFCNTSSF